MLLAFTLLTIGISVGPYRKGKRWAWFALWYAPFSLGDAAYNQYVAGYGLGLVFVAGLSVAWLLLPYRKFFPRK